MENLIKEDRIEDLRSQVFSVSFGDDSSSTYTRPLYADDEHAVVIQLLNSDRKEAWVDFLIEYIQHYPLFNKTEYFLLEYVEDEVVQKILAEDIKKYGCSEIIAVAVCNKAKKELKVLPLVDCVCNHSRIFSKQVYNLLESIDFMLNEKNEESHLADSYIKSIKMYHKNNGLPGF